MPERPERRSLFTNAHGADDLKSRSVGGGAVTMVAQAGKFAITLGSTAVLARMLAPEDFGLVAAVLAVVGLADRFKDFGLPMSTIQRKEITHEQVSTLFWINAGIAAGLTVLTAAAAPIVAWFYRDTSMVAVTLVLATTVIAGGLTVQHQALLRRSMQFGRLAALDVTGIVVSAGAAVGAAAAGAGYWSLVILQLGYSVVNLVGVWWLCPWRPGRAVRGSGVRPMLSFGGYLGAKGVLQVLAKSLDKMLVGRFCGADALGIYSKAWQLLLMPVAQLSVPLTAVAAATLSRLRDDPQRYRAFFEAGVQVLVFVAMPLVAFLFVAADELVRLVLGPQWGTVVPIYRVLAPAALMTTFNVATGWVYLSWGHTRRQFHWVAFASTVQMLAFFIGVQWGTIGVAAAFSVAVLLLRLPGVAVCFRGTPLRMGSFLLVIGRPAATSIGAGAATWFARAAIVPDAPLVARLALDGVVFVVAYLALWWVIPGGRGVLRDIVRLWPVIARRQPPEAADA